MSIHLSKQFDLDLESVRTHILAMGGLVEQQLSQAFKALSVGDFTLIDQVINGDKAVNQMDIDISAECISIIARRQPTARDLRLVIAISRIVTDLERVGDKAAKIAKLSRKLYQSNDKTITYLADVSYCAEIAIKMLNKSLDYFVRMDIFSAQALLEQDKIVDEAFNKVLIRLVDYMKESPDFIESALDIIWIAKAFERVGDHATNIAESIIYIISGSDIRHSAVN